MPERVCVFVDGENFRHAIVKLFNQFDQSDYLPRQADWRGLFDWIVQQASNDGVRVRTYWYVVEHLDSHPRRIPNAAKDPDGLKKLLCQDPAMKAELNNAQDDHELKKKLTEAHSRLNQRKVLGASASRAGKSYTTPYPGGIRPSSFAKPARYGTIFSKTP